MRREKKRREEKRRIKTANKFSPGVVDLYLDEDDWSRRKKGKVKNWGYKGLILIDLFGIVKVLKF